MELHEKLAQLRKERGLTQEELAQALYVSRTAVSKWESGRGCPSIDSLKLLSRHFGVSIDSLLSTEDALHLAQEENRHAMRTLRRTLLGVLDLLALSLILLPLYPHPVGDKMLSVSLFAYEGVSQWVLAAHAALYAALILLGAARLILVRTEKESVQRGMTALSLLLGTLGVLLPILAREPYTAAAALLLLSAKYLLLCCKNR